MTRAVFLDRDGTINEDVGYIHDPAMLEPIPGSVEAVKRLSDAGRAIIIVTNQASVARGIATEDQVRGVNATVVGWLAEAGVDNVHVYYCPHHPEAGEPPYRRLCGCRKPAAGMLYRAAGEHDLDLETAFMVGDHLSDIEAGKRAGCRSALVLTGHGRTQLDDTPEEDRHKIDHIAADLADAVDWILSQD